MNSIYADDLLLIYHEAARVVPVLRQNDQKTKACCFFGWLVVVLFLALRCFAPVWGLLLLLLAGVLWVLLLLVLCLFILLANCIVIVSGVVKVIT